MLGFLTGAVQDGAGPGGKMGSGLEQQRGLADAGLAAEQDERSRHEAAAKDAIELADPGGEPIGHDAFDVSVGAGRAAAEDRPRRARGLAFVRDFFLDVGIPRPAVGTAAEPLL